MVPQDQQLAVASGEFAREEAVLDSSFAINTLAAGLRCQKSGAVERSRSGQPC
jgi:hypothetical protein